VLPRYGGMGLTFAWLAKSGRLSKDYEALRQSEGTPVDLAMSNLMLTRLGSSAQEMAA